MSPNDTCGEAVIVGHLPPVGNRLPDLAEIKLRGWAILLSVVLAKGGQRDDQGKPLIEDGMWRGGCSWGSW
jgi:hypothetical protein